MARRGEYNRDSSRYYDWLEYAGEDLFCAMLLIEHNECANLSIFHSQQAIEKSLKGYYIFKTGTRIDGHNLTYLIRQVARHDKYLFKFLDITTELNSLYITTRYPSDVIELLTQEHANAIYNHAKTISDYIDNKVYKLETEI